MEVALEKTNSHDDDDNNIDEENPVPNAWRFNVFLDKIGQHLTEEEITRMKYLVNGEIGRAALDKAKTAMAFFQLLKDMEFLNTHNIILLQAMVWHIGRKDIHLQMVEFARGCRKEPLHFFSPKEKPANGYRHVKFHVRGSTVSRRQMENIRGYVAELLCIKVTDVFLVGHTPSNSSILTFMVPQTAVDVLQTLTAEDKETLATMNIDSIMIDDVTIQIDDEQIQMPTTNPETKEYARILQERDKLRSQLDRIQCRLVERTDELRKAKENEDLMRRSKDQAVITCLTLLYNHRPATRIIDSLVSKSALVYFKHCLQQFQAKFPGEMDTIEILLEAKELVACKTERELWKKHEQNLQLMITLGRNEIEMQQNVMNANTQGMHHNSHLAMGKTIVQLTRSIEIGLSVSGVAAPMIGMPNKLYQDKAVTKAMQQISKMIGTEQRRSILRHLGIGKRKRKSLERQDFSFMKLYQLQPRCETPLDFVLQTVCHLNDENLEEHVLKTIQDVQIACDRHRRAVQQGAMTAPQVRFSDGQQKRQMEPDALMRLHNDPKEPKDGVNILQDLADMVQA